MKNISDNLVTIKLSQLATQIKEATILGDKIKKIIPKDMDNQIIILALTYLANDIAKEDPDFKKKKKEILEQIESTFELWGNC